MTVRYLERSECKIRESGLTVWMQQNLADGVRAAPSDPLLIVFSCP